MNYLLDTSALIWYLLGNDKITTELLDTIQSNKNKVYFSSVNIIEISIKVSIGKLKIDDAYLNYLQKSPFIELQLNSTHALKLQSLPFLHKDPFDRLLIAQAKVENLTIITRDKIFKDYEVNILKVR